MKKNLYEILFCFCLVTVSGTCLSSSLDIKNSPCNNSLLTIENETSDSMTVSLVMSENGELVNGPANDTLDPFTPVTYTLTSVSGSGGDISGSITSEVVNTTTISVVDFEFKTNSLRTDCEPSGTIQEEFDNGMDIQIAHVTRSIGDDDPAELVVEFTNPDEDENKNQAN